MANEPVILNVYDMVRPSSADGTSPSQINIAGAPAAVPVFKVYSAFEPY